MTWEAIDSISSWMWSLAIRQHPNNPYAAAVTFARMRAEHLR